MRRDRFLTCIFFALLFIWFLAAISHGGEPKKKKPPKPDTIAILSSRVHSVRWHTTAAEEIVTMVPFEGNDYKEEGVAILEFSDGGIGIYIAREDEDNDEWVTLTRAAVRSKIFEDILKRSSTR